MRYAFGRDAFAMFVHAKRTMTRQLTMQQAADAAGVSKAQIFRAEHGQPIDAGAMLALCLWIGHNPFGFLLETATGRCMPDLPEPVFPVEQQVKRRKA